MFQWKKNLVQTYKHTLILCDYSKIDIRFSEEIQAAQYRFNPILLWAKYVNCRKILHHRLELADFFFFVGLGSPAQLRMRGRASELT